MRHLFTRAASTVLLGLLSTGAFAADITVEDAFARASAGMVQTGAAFMTLKNSGSVDDKLIAAHSPVATQVELHTHIKDGEVMRMRPVPSIDVPAGGSATLQPGGLHIMLIGLKAPLKQGEQFPLTLSFAKAGEMTIEVPVKSPGAMSPMPMPMKNH
ncbi:MAG: copper chaperone PCu(A)C [Rhodospirillales bacterium]|nr:copper chaperone PCu(A)C [Rhodospirillales bacterium]